MHTAAIFQIGVDAANRYLVTGSEDKTVRVWELASGRLLRTLRLPIGSGNEGKVFGVALSPDGTTVAAGGATRAVPGMHHTLSISLTARVADYSGALPACLVK
jgi:WD40 repeat protein